MSNKINLTGRSLLSLDDLADAELLHLLDLSARLKRKKQRHFRGRLLLNKNIALVFEKASTRTRCAAVIAAADEAGVAEYIESGNTHFGKKESIKDSARVLGRMFDGILFRGFKHSTVETLARHSGIPVWNGLTDEDHPTQAMADIMTIREHFGALKGLKVVYIGDGRNNVALSLMTACAKAGINFVDCAPPELNPPEHRVARALEAAGRNGSTIAVSADPGEAVRGANVIYTDVWTSMGEEAMFAERARLLRPYQVNRELVARTGNLENGRVIFLHCLPAFHNNETAVTKDIGALEVTDEVFEAPYSKVFDLAENRMHTIKALMVATLTGKG